ncbi:sensor histidine kinase [Falsiroseomonas sp.]|uniref:sensor histidine kinase n=1 Tax=Falsiroseomonas sp. TaxID=2870721 RepID=UPI0034A3869C
MDAVYLSIALVAVSMTALVGAFWFRAALSEARHRAERAEHLAGARTRSMSLAAQELRGVVAGLAGGRGAAPDGIEPLAQRLLRVADDLTDVAKAHDARVIRDIPTPLGPIVDSAIAKVAVQIRPATRHWQVDPGLSGLTVKADGRALEGALVALLRRAASHSQDGDAVALRWVLASETVAIVIEDEGEGRAAPDLVPDTTAPAIGTRGLDLALNLARSLAAAHGGDIRLETAPGIGARAWLTLPRARLLASA